MAYDIRIREVEVLVALEKTGKAGLDGGYKRSVSVKPSHLLPTCLQPFEDGYCPGDSRFGVIRENMLCPGDFLLHDE